MKAPPLLFGGRTPVVAYLRHSMIVWHSSQQAHQPNWRHSYRLPRAIVADDQSQRSVKLDGLLADVVKGADSGEGQKKVRASMTTYIHTLEWKAYRVSLGFVQSTLHRDLEASTAQHTYTCKWYLVSQDHLY